MGFIPGVIEGVQPEGSGAAVHRDLYARIVLRIKAFIEAEWGARAVREQNTYVAGRLAAAVERQHAVFRRAGRRGAVNHNIVRPFSQSLTRMSMPTAGPVPD